MLAEWLVANLANVLWLCFGLFTVLWLVGNAVYVVKQWEKVAVIRLGKILKIMETGLHFKIPFIDEIKRVDLRTQTVDLKGQSAITKDNISVGVDAVVFMKVEDPEKVILNIKDYHNAVSKHAQSVIRNIVGKFDLDGLLESREVLAKNLRMEIDELVNEWGVDIPKAGIQDISLPRDMKRAFAVQAEAEREARAILTKANAELNSSKILKEAGRELAESPNAMQLRILSTINDVSKDQSNTIILALPLETLTSAGIQGVAALSSIRPKHEQGT